MVLPHHLSLNREGRLGTTYDFATSFLHFSLFSPALWDLANSRPAHSLLLSSHLFLCLPCLLPPFSAPCKMVLARPDEQETWPYCSSLHLFTMVRRPSRGPVACWIMARTFSLVTCGSYMHLKAEAQYTLCNWLYLRDITNMILFNFAFKCESFEHLLFLYGFVVYFRETVYLFSNLVEQFDFGSS